MRLFSGKTYSDECQTLDFVCWACDTAVQHTSNYVRRYRVAL